MAEYDYLIEVKELNPPMGKLKYFAKVSNFFQRVGVNHGRLSVEFGEAWGETDTEAIKILPRNFKRGLNYIHHHEQCCDPATIQ